MGYVILAFDFEQFVLVLVAVDFSTWLVLPWAFYQKLKDDSLLEKTDSTTAARAKRHLGWLRDGESLFLASGVFLMLFVLSSLALESTVLDPFLKGVLPLMNVLLALFGFTLLFGGLFDAVRVVNYFSEIRTGQRDLLRLGAAPFFLFNALLLVLELFQVIPYVSAMNSAGWTYFIALWVLFGSVLLSNKWIDYVYLLGEGVNFRGLASIVLLALPILALFIYAFLFAHGYAIYNPVTTTASNTLTTTITVTTTTAS